MAEAITVQPNDTISRILKEKKGIPEVRQQPWLTVIRKLNPHIRDINYIYPGESILLPDSVNESVSRTKIWQNAFSLIPKTLHFGNQEETVLYFAVAGDTINKVAKLVFPTGPYQKLHTSTKRALLIHNNPFLEMQLPNENLAMNCLINITPTMIDAYDKLHWLQVHKPLTTDLAAMQKQLAEMLEKGAAEQAWSMAKMVEWLRSERVAVGREDPVQLVEAGSAIASGIAASGSKSVGTLDMLTRDLYNEAIKKFGSKVVHSKSPKDLAQVQRFLKSSPKYAETMRHLKDLPQWVSSKSPIKMPSSSANNAMARNFRRQISLPLKKWGNPSKYVNTISRQLNGRMSYFKTMGTRATWVIPVVLGGYSVVTAPPELRMSRLFEEGFGIIGGAIGTWAGSAIIAAGAVSLFALCGICLGPLGIFITVFVCATAGGIVGMDLFKNLGKGIYDFGSKHQEGRIYTTPEQFLSELR